MVFIFLVVNWSLVKHGEGTVDSGHNLNTNSQHYLLSFVVSIVYNVTHRNFNINKLL